MKELKYLNHYHPDTQAQVHALIKKDKLAEHILSKYPRAHNIKTDKALFSYTMDYKDDHMKKSAPLSKVLYDGKVQTLNALGTHRFISRVQGGKLKAKNEIRVASMFKSVPQDFLEMIVVHELAHFKEKEHNKAFYKLCAHMEPDYHQLEFDTRLYMTHMELYGKLYG
jgi:predicted metal-dependent hydrolase